MFQVANHDFKLEIICEGGHTRFAKSPETQQTVFTIAVVDPKLNLFVEDGFQNDVYKEPKSLDWVIKG